MTVTVEKQIRIYALDVETRLMIDSLDFEEKKEELSYIEREAFLLFKSLLEEQLEHVAIPEKDFSVSLEHLQFDRSIQMLVNIIESMENLLYSQALFYTEGDEVDGAKLRAAVLTMACLYRYPFGLYDSNGTVENYIQQKASQYPSFQSFFDGNFSLETLRKEARNHYKQTTSVNELKEYFGKEVDYHWESDNIEFLAYFNLNRYLSKIQLSSNGNWQYPEDRELSYWELRVIMGDLLSACRNDLRESHVKDIESEIRSNVYAINLTSNFYIGRHTSERLPVEEIPKEAALHSTFLQVGMLGASIYETSLKYADDVRILGTRGRGVAAERANHIIDRMMGKRATLEGDDNSKNGADRIVGNDYIQTKYCRTGGECISECFEDGKFRYEHNGKPMKIEVPKDKYEAAVKSLQDRIERGDMKDLGITDPEAAKDIIKKGNISYKTARRIAKAGTIEGVMYDAGTGMVHATQAFGISVTISFAQSMWRGEEVEDALSDALETGGKIFGASLVTHIATKQIGRTVVEKSLRPMTDYVTKEMLGSKASAKIVNTFLRKSGQKAIHGAAATNQLSKVLRGNIVTMAVTTAVMSSGHIYDAVEGRISGKQLFKNISTVGAGVGGAAMGASMGSVVPVVGTIIGGMVGGILGGKASKKALDSLIEDDAVSLFEILKEVFTESISELELDREELNFIMEYIFDGKELPKTLKNIHAASDGKAYIEKMLDPYIDAILKSRPKIVA